MTLKDISRLKVEAPNNIDEWRGMRKVAEALEELPGFECECVTAVNRVPKEDLMHCEGLESYLRETAARMLAEEILINGFIEFTRQDTIPLDEVGVVAVVARVYVARKIKDKEDTE